MDNFKVFNIPTFKDSKGTLTVLDGILPFKIVRTFWIYGSDHQLRGGHRHHKTRQALIAIQGSVDIYMNNGIFSEVIPLLSPDKCLIVEPEDWHTMTFGSGAVLLVFASHEYDKSDYIDQPY